MKRGKSVEMKIGGNAGQKPRAAYYEDYAKPILVNWPFMLVAAATLFVVGHFANRRAGRRLGGDQQNKRSSTGDSNGRPSTSNGRDESSLSRRGNQPMSLAELRTLRAEAAEARLKSWKGSVSSPGVAKPTPLGLILQLAQKVNELEEGVNAFLETLEHTPLELKGEKEHSRLLELLTQVQLEIDGVESDESVRPHRKLQTKRVQSLIQALEGIDRKS